MKFHLNYIPKKSSFQIDHESSILLAGSCFAENIGNLLTGYKFKTLVNPDGILFNPTSIYNSLNKILQNNKTDERFILEREGLFYSFLHHTSFSSTNKKDLIKKLNSENDIAHRFLKSANILIITFGTAFSYYHEKLAETIANCHKQAADTFEKKLLEVDEIVTSYSELIKNLKILNPALKIIFTVSPVKYLKDGVQENNLSKSTLVLSIHKIIAENPNCFYFPSFELVNDDLRDYRFYKEDLAHPNQMAIDYIWEKFSDSYFSQKTIELNQQINKLNLALNHRQMQENSLENEKLLAFIEKQKQEILKLNPSLDL